MKKVKRHKVDNKKVQNTWSDSQMENPESLTFFFFMMWDLESSWRVHIYLNNIFFSNNLQMWESFLK